MEAKRVEDLIIYLDEYPAILSTATIHEAVEIFEDFQITVGTRQSLPRTLLVMNKQDHLVGLIRRRDLLRGLLPDYLEGDRLTYKKKWFDVKVDPNLTELSFEKLISHFRERAERPVRDIMLTEIITINYGDNLLKAVSLIVDNDITLLPIMNNSKVVGVVRSVDVFNEIAKHVL